LTAATGIARVIYGQILAMSLVVALSEDESLGAGDILLWLLVTMAVFWLAHAYADVLAARLERDEGTLGSQIRRSLGGEWPLVQAAAVPGFALFLGSVGALSRDSAVDLAIALGVAQLALWGVAIGRSRGLDPKGVLASAGSSAAFGLVLVGLKVFVH
jgi:hypothetical protein